MKEDKHVSNCKGPAGFSTYSFENGDICWCTLVNGGLKKERISRDEATRRILGLIKANKPVLPSACKMLGITPPGQMKREPGGNQRSRKKRK